MAKPMEIKLAEPKRLRLNGIELTVIRFTTACSFDCFCTAYRASHSACHDVRYQHWYERIKSTIERCKACDDASDNANDRGQTKRPFVEAVAMPVIASVIILTGVSFRNRDSHEKRDSNHSLIVSLKY
jgi:hypothetical protein